MGDVVSQSWNQMDTGSPTYCISKKLDDVEAKPAEVEQGHNG